MTVTRTFVSWHRSGFAASLTGHPAAGTARAALPATVSLAGDGVPRTGRVPVELAGPGDVVGLDPTEVRRCEPFDGCADFEPEYLPYVELVSPDLPWRFTPVGPATGTLADPEHGAGAHQQQRLQPWLALVVVDADRLALAPAAPGGLPVLTCPGSELPDPAESWAWAHVQVTTTGDDDTDPGLGLARLVCPRRLTAGTAYRGFLVPTYAAGLAAAGIDLGARDPLSPAWATTDAQVRLPVYYSFSFTTGLAGTFEQLARRLRPRAAPAATAGRTIALEAPGWGVVGRAGSTTVMQGALRPVPGAETPAEVPTSAAYATALAGAVSTTGGTLELRPPLYGQDYAGGTTAVSAGTRGWLTQLNTDPRRRLAAGLGAWVVAVMQDQLVDRAWAWWRDHGGTSTDLGTVVGSTVTGRADGTLQAAVPTTLARLARRGTALALPVAAAPPRPAAGALSAPVFEDAAWSWLAAVAPEWLLPGAGDIADDTVVVLQTNPAFVESFLVGLNHALARELSWRRFPVDSAHTMVTRFWSSAPGAPDPSVGAVADWDPSSTLGTHGPAGDRLVLLVRGALLRRFPTASIYLAGVRADGSEQHLTPGIAARLDPSTTFYGFDLTPTEARTPSTASGVRSWSLVVQESVDHLRLGLDAAPDGGGTAPLTTWEDLDWGHPHVLDATHVPVDGPLLGLNRPVAGGPAGSAPTAVWGADAAQLAAALTRPAFRVRIPISLWLET